MVPHRDPALPPTWSERRVLQMLLADTWLSADDLGRPREVLLANLVEKGWIQKGGEGRSQYRITAAGSSAFHTPLRIGMPRGHPE